MTLMLYIALQPNDLVKAVTTGGAAAGRAKVDNKKDTGIVAGGAAEAGLPATPDPQRKLNVGVEYEYESSGTQPGGEGWERTSGEGWRRPIGSGGGKAKKVDTTGGETPKEQEEQAAAGTQGTTDPFSPNPEDFESDGPMEHYQHIQTHSAQEGTDPKLTQMHRELINEKTEDFTAEDHTALASQLGNEGMEDEAGKHNAVAQSMQANAQQTEEPEPTPEQAAAADQEKKDQEKDDKTQATSDKKVAKAEEKQVKATEAHKEATAASDEAEKGVKQTAEEVNTTQKVAGKAADELTVAEKANHEAEESVEEHKTDINKLARENLALQDRLRNHKDNTPQHSDYEDTDKYNAAKSKHNLVGKAIQAKVSQNKSDVGKHKQELTEAKGAQQKTKKTLSVASKADKDASRAYEKAEKNEATAQKKVETTATKAEKAATAVDDSTVGVEDAKTESAAKAQESEEKAVEKKKAAQPGLLAGAARGFHSGRAAGEAVGSAAASEQPGSVVSSTINYGTSGAVRAGHYLLHPKGKNTQLGAGART